MEPRKCCLSFIFQGMSHEAPEEEERVLNVQDLQDIWNTHTFLVSCP